MVSAGKKSDVEALLPIIRLLARQVGDELEAAQARRLHKSGLKRPRRRSIPVLMTERERIKAILAFALRHKASGLVWKRHGDDAAVEIAAERVLAHLELANVRLSIGPPSPLHGTPAPRSGP